MNRDHLSNLIFGLTFLNLAIVGFCELTFSCTFLTIVRLGAIMCNIIMGVILIFNNHSKAKSSPLYKPYWLGMIICNILIVKMIEASYSEASLLSFIFIIGFIIVMVSLFSLGRSFTVSPMLSQIKTRYIYKFVRHPMYLGESVMLLACILASESVMSILLFLIFLLITVLRIREEEKLLMQTKHYKKYCSSTPWRLFPYIW